MLKGFLITLLAGLALLVGGASVLAALPATTNYQLNSFGFGSGGTANSTTSNYTLEGITGELFGQPGSTATYADNSGFIQTQQSNVPKITISNPSLFYDKLKFVIDEQGNPSDAKYALQVCIGADFTPACGGTTMYVKSDNTLGASLTITDYQTYAAWGGASGANIIGLTSNTTYYIRAKATHFIANTNKITTESAYGPTTNAATVGQQLSFCLYTTSCGSGNSVAFGSLFAGTVTDGSSTIGIDFATNANSGGNVYVYSANSGLKSLSASNYTIASATADLTSVLEGFGAQISSVGQTTGGPFTKVSPYDGASNNVGALSTSINTLLTSANPIIGGNSTIQLKAKSKNITPAAVDYADILTFIAAASF